MAAGAGPDVLRPFNGQIRPQPVVLLASVSTGAKPWVMNVHSSPQGMDGEHDRATQIEIPEVNKLLATGLPVILTGHCNEKIKSLLFESPRPPSS